MIARELGRTPSSVNNRLRILKDRMGRRHPEILAKHREEELQLLDQLIEEQSYPEMHEEEC